jgi:hypothetical protein
MNKVLQLICLLSLITSSIFAQTSKIDTCNILFNIMGNTSFCQGTNTTFMASPGFAAYAWSNGINTRTNTVSIGGTYTVTVTDSGGCTATKSHTITMKPTPTAIITQNTPLCVDGSATLTVTGGDMYMWSNFSSNPVINVTAVGLYTVRATSSCGSSTSSIVVIQNQNPTPTASINSTNVICTGSTAVLSATGGNLYMWSDSSNMATLVVAPTVSTVYTVIATNGTSSCTASATSQIVVNPTPTVTITQNGNQLTANGGNNHTYIWSNGYTSANIPISNANTYTVTATNQYGCSSTASVLAFFTAVENTNSLAANVRLYPNPVHEMIAIESTERIKTIEITDILGRKINTILANHLNTLQINIDHLPEGSYFVSIFCENGVVTKKIVVTKQ